MALEQQLFFFSFSFSVFLNSQSQPAVQEGQKKILIPDCSCSPFALWPVERREAANGLPPYVQQKRVGEGGETDWLWATSYSHCFHYDFPADQVEIFCYYWLIDPFLVMVKVMVDGDVHTKVLSQNYNRNNASFPGRSVYWQNERRNYGTLLNYLKIYQDIWWNRGSFMCVCVCAHAFVHACVCEKMKLHLRDTKSCYPDRHYFL